jgi:molybdopterin-guanine dinucleotide biosynthesis protein A
MIRRAAIILAGGKGKRFQSQPEIWQDKALAMLFDKPLLVHAVESVRKAVEEIVICVNDEDRRALYAQMLEKHGVSDVKLVIDQKIDSLGGPLVAILTGLKAVTADYCFTLPGDMPLLQLKVIKYMFNLAKHSRVVVPMWPNGRLETLVMALKKTSALEIADTLCLLGRPRSDDLIRGALTVTFASIVGELRALDPELESFVNINFPEDLTLLQPRLVAGEITQNLRLDIGALPDRELCLMRRASGLCRENKLSEASEVFASCASRLEEDQSFFWAALSRENEAKSIRGLAKQQTESFLREKETVRSARLFLKAAVNYDLEAKMHEKCHCVFLAERARSDKVWCNSRADELSFKKF